MCCEELSEDFIIARFPQLVQGSIDRESSRFPSQGCRLSSALNEIHVRTPHWHCHQGKKSHPSPKRYFKQMKNIQETFQSKEARKQVVQRAKWK